MNMSCLRTSGQRLSAVADEQRKVPNVRLHRTVTTRVVPAGDRHSDRFTLHYRRTIDVIHQFTGTMADVAVENDAPEFTTEEAAKMVKSFICGKPSRNAVTRSAKQDMSIPL